MCIFINKNNCMWEAWSTQKRSCKNQRIYRDQRTVTVRHTTARLSGIMLSCIPVDPTEKRTHPYDLNTDSTQGTQAASAALMWRNCADRDKRESGSGRTPSEKYDPKQGGWVSAIKQLHQKWPNHFKSQIWCEQ